MPVGHSGRYLVAAAIFTLVALAGTVLVVTSDHDALGMALLLSGDAFMIVTWVDYLCRP